MKIQNAKNIDGDAQGARPSPGRVLIEASCGGMLTLPLIDLATRVPGGTS